MDDVAERLAEVTDLADRGVVPRRARRAYPLAAIFLGCLKLPSFEGTPPDEILDIATVLELMDMAVVAHYYESEPPADECLIAGDHWYARAMTIAADQGKPELVRRLAEATSEVARGHAQPMESANLEPTLALRSALFPAGVDLAAIVSGTAVTGDEVMLARRLGIAREMVLAKLAAARDQLVEIEAALAKRAGDIKLFSSQNMYLTNFVHELLDDSEWLL